MKTATATKEDPSAFEEIMARSQEFARQYAAHTEPAFYPSPIRLPEKRSGRISIRHRPVPPGTRLDVVSLRTAIMTGRQATAAIIQEPGFIIHELHDDNRGIWMTDLPSELNEAYEAIQHVKPWGRVLVGGLGLGVLPALLAMRQTVTRITVVEQNRDVVKLCARDGYKTVRDTIQRHIATTKSRYDAVFLDVWQSQSESEFWDLVFPLKRLVRNRLGDVPIWCWKEDGFMSQGYRSLRLSKERHWFHGNLPTPMSHEEACFFLAKVGTPAWEKQYGKFIAKKRGST